MEQAQKQQPETEIIIDDAQTARVLAVDDDRTMLLMLESQLEELGYEVLTARDGAEALSILEEEQNRIDMILLDREMPKMSGMEVVARVMDDPELRKIPIIMQTGSDQPKQIKEGIDAGVYYYLTKPIDGEILKSVLTAAFREVCQQKILKSELKQHKTSFHLIDSCKFFYNSLLEAESLACFIANCYPSPERVVSGLAELLINAVEHGNFGMGYDEKTELIKLGNWREELLRRPNFPEHRNKRVEVILRCKEDGIHLKITDEGIGFDWRKYLHVDPSRAQDNHGRGVAQANAISFDQVTYNDVGNQVTAFVSKEESLEW